MFIGKVMHGDGMGAKYGYPTANLDTKPEDTHLKVGVYAGYAWRRNKKYPAAIVLQGNPWKVEVHLLGFTGDLCDEELKVDPLQRISEIETCDTDEAMIEKIRHDIELVKSFLEV